MASLFCQNCQTGGKGSGLLNSLLRGAKVSICCHGYMLVFIKLKQNTAMGRFLMAGFLLGGSDLIRKHLV